MFEASALAIIYHTDMSDNVGIHLASHHTQKVYKQRLMLLGFGCLLYEPWEFSTTGSLVNSG